MKSPTIIAIDPGISGALACVKYDVNGKPVNVHVADMPVFKVEKDRLFNSNRSKTKHFTLVDCRKIGHQLHEWPLADVVVVEKVLVNKTNNQGETQTSSDTREISLINEGRIMAGVESRYPAWNYEYTIIPPSSWKRAIGASYDKERCRTHAVQLFPQAAELLSRKMDHDRAEALLLTLYGFWHLWMPRQKG